MKKLENGHFFTEKVLFVCLFIFVQGVAPQEYTGIKMKIVEPFKGKLRYLLLITCTFEPVSNQLGKPNQHSL